jgi:TolA-binding protein
MSNGMADQARKKLQEIIDTYPDDPAAQTAKDLLSQMKQ